MRWGQQKIVFETWNPAQNTIHAILTLFIFIFFIFHFSFFFQFFFQKIFFTDEAHLGWLQNDNHWNSSAFSRLTYKTNQTYQKTSKNSEICQKCVLLGTQRGGGHLGVTVFATGGGGGGGARKIFRKGDSFWRFPPLLPKRQKLSTFRKNFSCPPRCEHSNTQMSPPPPRCVPSKTPYYSMKCLHVHCDKRVRPIKPRSSFDTLLNNLFFSMPQLLINEIYINLYNCLALKQQNSKFSKHLKRCLCGSNLPSSPEFLVQIRIIFVLPILWGMHAQNYQFFSEEWNNMSRTVRNYTNFGFKMP